MGSIAGLVNKNRRVQAAMTQVKAVTLKDSVGQVIQIIHQTAPTDTNRFVRACIQAGRDAGVTQLPLPAIVTSKYIHDYIDILTDQVRRYGDEARRLQNLIRHWYGDGSSRGPAFRKLKAQQNKALQRLKRAEEELAKARGSGSVLLFDSARSGDRRLTTVRVPIYGGRGRVFEIAGVLFVELHILEAHSKIVERQHGTIAKASGTFKGTLQRRGKGYLKKLAESSR